MFYQTDVKEFDPPRDQGSWWSEWGVDKSDLCHQAARRVVVVVVVVVVWGGEGGVKLVLAKRVRLHATL